MVSFQEKSRKRNKSFALELGRTYPEKFFSARVVLCLTILTPGAYLGNLAKKKMPDLNAASVEAAMRTVEGTARSMGIEIGRASCRERV